MYVYTSDLKGLKVCKQTHLTKGESVNRRVCHIKKFHVTRAVVIGGGGGGGGSDAEGCEASNIDCNWSSICNLPMQSGREK